MEPSPVRERLLAFLKTCARPTPADEALKEALGIHSPNLTAADRLLRTIAGDDPRFHSDKDGWMAASPVSGRNADSWTEASALYIQASPPSAIPRHIRGALHVRASGRREELSFATPTCDAGPGALQQARSLAEQCRLVMWSPREHRLWNQLLRGHRLPEYHAATVYLSTLVKRVFPRTGPSAAPEDLASALGLTSPDAENPAAMARFYMEAFTSLLERVPGECRGDLESLSAWIEAGKPRIDFSRFAFSRAFLKDIPEHPGVYIMRNRAGVIIYVGKAGNLKRRVRSYFTTRGLEDPRIAKIHGQLHTLEFTVAASEVEALVMEMRLIRDFQPQFNLQAAVHERPARYGRLRNMIILVLEEPKAQKATAYLVRDSLFTGRETVRLGSNPGRRLRARVQSIYFARRPKRRSPSEEWEQEIISRWLTSNMKRLNAVDVDEAGDYTSVIRQLRAFLHDPDALSNKVYYR